MTRDYPADTFEFSQTWHGDPSSELAPPPGDGWLLISVAPVDVQDGHVVCIWARPRTVEAEPEPAAAAGQAVIDAAVEWRTTGPDWKLYLITDAVDAYRAAKERVKP